MNEQTNKPREEKRKSNEWTRTGKKDRFFSLEKTGQTLKTKFKL